LLLNQFDLAGLRFRFVSSTDLSCFIPERFKAFQSESINSEVNVTYVLANSLETSSHVADIIHNLLPIFARIPTDIADSQVNHLILSFFPFCDILTNCSEHANRVMLELRKNSAVISDFLRHSIDIFYTGDIVLYLAGSQINPTAFSSFLHDFDALMIHSSSVSFNGRAAIFLAMDEGGKTTAATLCEGGRVLSDDQNLFRKQTDGSWLAYGTPWTTFPPDPGSAVPAAFFLLEKADEFSLLKVGALELFSFLWDEHFSSRFMVPKVYQTKLFDLYNDLSASAPVYLMKFPKDYIDQEAIMKCLKN
jgi:hypothetical protein